MLAYKGSRISILLSLLLPAFLINATPIQYCKSTINFNFCLALESFKNATTEATDAYMTLVTVREVASPIGWNAVGLGDQMAGALMFVMYGDPKDKTGPTVSVRTTTEHKQPTVLANHPDKAFPDVRIAGTEYSSTKDSPQSTLTAHIICYSCDKWAGRLSTQPFQPFIYAANDEQDFEIDYQPTVDLMMHSHDFQSFGIFYANIDQSLAADGATLAAPAITNTKTNTYAQDTPPIGFKAKAANRTWRGKMWAVHGILMTVSFMFLHPLGVIAMRGGIPQAFKYHSILQLAASITSTTGAIIGILLSRRYTRYHQYLGILLLLSTLAQAYFGWRHHMIYVRSKSRTWVSTVHVWLGRCILMAGWLNMVMGMILKHWSTMWILLTMALIAVVGGSVFFSTVLTNFAKQYRTLDSFTQGIPLSSSTERGGEFQEDQPFEDYLAEDDDDSDDDPYRVGNDDEQKEIYSKEARGGMPGTGLMAGIPASGLDEDEEEDKKRWIPK